MFIDCEDTAGEIVIPCVLCKNKKYKKKKRDEGVRALNLQ